MGRRNRNAGGRGGRRRYVAKGARCPRTGKTSYRDEQAARREMTRLAARDDGRPKQVRVYPCEFCGKWHLTKQNRA